MLQSAPGLKVVMQGFVWGKSVFVEMAETVSVALPLFVSVTDCGTLVVPTA
jgi:hypothetical protein